MWIVSVGLRSHYEEVLTGKDGAIWTSKRIITAMDETVNIIKYTNVSDAEF